LKERSITKTASFTYPLKREPIPLQVARRIMQSIVSGELKPGESLPNERDLAASLGVARPTIREAIRALQMMRVLTVRQGGATQVSELSPEALIEPFELMCHAGALDIAALFEVRLALEVGVARAAAARISDAELEELYACMADAEQSVGTPSRFLEIDMALHDVILRAARNPLYTTLMGAIWRLGRESRKQTTQLDEVRASTVAEHRQIVLALRDRDPNRAGNAMYNHISSVAAKFLGQADKKHIEESKSGKRALSAEREK
jgi:GntR family transcriptional regulator, transcriptional repressor for pyruvate dehydrogenase complex